MSWVPNPVVGDMYYENVYTQYREVGGVQIPRFHQHQDYDDGAHEPNVSGGDHAFGLETVSDLQANVANAALTVPDDVQRARIQPVRVESQRLGDGVWLVGGGSHHSVAVEFADHVAVIEAPLHEERSLAVIDEVYRLIPDKPIRFIVTTHHHWDHLGGLRAYVHEGATVITHERNKPYYQEVLRAGLWRTVQQFDRRCPTGRFYAGPSPGCDVREGRLLRSPTCRRFPKPSSSSSWRSRAGSISSSVM